MAKEDAVDEQKVVEMRRLMQEGGDKAVTRRYGAAATNSQEFQTAQRQREAARRQAEKVRLEAAAQSRERTDQARKQAERQQAVKASTSASAQSKRDQMLQSLRERDARQDTGRTR